MSFWPVLQHSLNPSVHDIARFYSFQFKWKSLVLHSLIYFCIIPFSLINSCFTIPPLSSSDHKGLLVSLHNDVVILSNSSRTVWCYSQENFDLAWTYLMKVTGTQCSPMHPMWISCGLPGKRGSLRLWNLHPQKMTSLKKCLPWLSPSLLSAMKKDKLSFRIIQTHWLSQWQRNLGKTAIRHTKTSFLNHLNHASPKVTVQAILKYSNTLLWWLTFATSDYDKANCLNKQFYNNFNHSYPHYQLSSARLYKPCGLFQCVSYYVLKMTL